MLARILTDTIYCLIVENERHFLLECVAEIENELETIKTSSIWSLLIIMQVAFLVEIFMASKKSI
jgi:hypothetical protein